MTMTSQATSCEQTLHAALELSKNSWLLAIRRFKRSKGCTRTTSSWQRRSTKSPQARAPVNDVRGEAEIASIEFRSDRRNLTNRDAT